MLMFFRDLICVIRRRIDGLRLRLTCGGARMTNEGGSEQL
jgi:hypothetical protein